MNNMQGMQLNTDFTNIAPNLPGGAQFPVTTDKLGHLVQIIESGPRETKDKGGMRLVLKMEILDGPHKGTVGEHGINVANANQDAVRIGYSEISAIAHVTGTLRVGNSAELHRKPFRILVRQQKGDASYTEIYGVLDANGNEPGKAGQGPLNAGQPGGGFGGAPGNGFGGGAPQGGFQPGPGQGAPQGGGNANWQPNPGQDQQGGGGGQPGWTGGGNQQQQPPQNGAPGWGPGGGNAQGGGAPGWAGGGQPGN